MDQILIIGGNGFIGRHLAKWYFQNTNDKIYIIDSFLSSDPPQIDCLDETKWTTLSDRVFIRNCNASNIMDTCNDLFPKIVFHFGEFSRINESWNYHSFVIQNNIIGTNAVLEFCIKKNAFLVYSASSAILGESNDPSPYVFTKRVNVENIRNYERWYGLRYMITYFYNVYGEGQISEGSWATVLGIFLDQYKRGNPLTVAKPGTQKRCFTHVDDIVDGIITAINLLKLGKISVRDIPISSNDEISISDLAKKFSDNIIYLEERRGDRLNSVKSLPDILRLTGWDSKVNLNDWILSSKNGLEY